MCIDRDELALVEKSSREGLGDDEQRRLDGYHAEAVEKFNNRNLVVSQSSE
jgi:hypothetical protein